MEEGEKKSLFWKYTMGTNTPAQSKGLDLSLTILVFLNRTVPCKYPSVAV